MNRSLSRGCEPCLSVDTLGRLFGLDSTGRRRSGLSAAQMPGEYRSATGRFVAVVSLRFDGRDEAAGITAAGAAEGNIRVNRPSISLLQATDRGTGDAES